MKKFVKPHDVIIMTDAEKNNNKKEKKQAYNQLKSLNKHTHKIFKKGAIFTKKEKKTVLDSPI